jgi:hypothetical protein
MNKILYSLNQQRVVRRGDIKVLWIRRRNFMQRIKKC